MVKDKPTYPYCYENKSKNVQKSACVVLKSFAKLRLFLGNRKVGLFKAVQTKNRSPS